VFDLAGRSFGRGAWLHPDPGCLAEAARGGIDRAFRAQLGVSAAALAQAFRKAADRRALALLGAARRAQKLEAGSSSVADAIERGRAELVIVATDARAAASHAFLEPLIAAGRAQAYGTKAEFGACLARSETALLAVTEARFAREIRKAIEWALLPEPKAASARAARTISSEAG
jgi:ribosomal protein L7Ae-like RNA K-turn-binding protein